MINYNALTYEDQLKLKQTENAIAQMSREQLEDFAKLTLFEHLCMKHTYQELLAKEWGITDDTKRES